MPAEPGTDPDRFTRCQAVLEPDSVPVAPEPIQLAFSVPDSIGTVTTATADEDSGIVVAGVDNEAKTVTVDTRSALEGSWTLTFTSDSARTCIGNVNVVLQKRRGGM
jgi:hypothetical protein